MVSKLLRQVLVFPGHIYRYGPHRSLNYILYELDKYGKRLVCCALPPNIIIEPHTFCNLSCITCATGQNQLNRPKGKMPWDMFKKVVNEIAPWIKRVYWTGACEPLLYEDSLRFIKYMTAAGLEVYVETNGHFFWKRDFTERFIRTNVSGVNIAFDGVDQASLQAFRGPNANYDRLISGIQLLLELRQKLHTKKPIVNLQFIVTRLNEHLIDKVKALKAELRPDTFMFKAVGLDLSAKEQFENLIPAALEFRRYERGMHGVWRLKGEIANRCSTMYFRPMILWDGRLVPCCYDFSAEYSFGNVFETSFRKAWNSETAVNFRQQILRNRSAISICRYCPEGRTTLLHKQ